MIKRFVSRALLTVWIGALSACGASGDKNEKPVAEQPRSLTVVSSRQSSQINVENSSSVISSLASSMSANVSNSNSSVSSSRNSSTVVSSSSLMSSSVSSSRSSSTSVSTSSNSSLNTNSQSSSSSSVNVSSSSSQASSNTGISLVVLEETFDDMVFPTGRTNFVIGDLFMGWQSGGQLSIENDPYRTGKSIKAHYPISDGQGSVANWMSFYTLSTYKTYEILVEFDARMPGTPGGAKFFKIFGVDPGQSGFPDKANTTFGLISNEGNSSENGSLYQISFGDGSITDNDTDNVINLSGESLEQVGRSWGKGATIITGGVWKSTDWQDGWHHFETRAKFNTGNCIAGETPVPEINDGAYLLKIDGKIYVEATGLFNRHCQNHPIDRFDFFNHAQNTTIPFEIWIDNLKVTVVY